MNPIPSACWERMKAFLEAAKTGQIVLHVKEGKILAWELTDRSSLKKQIDDPGLSEIVS